MTDVLIVGAGPTGLVAALELQRRGIAFRIIDEKEGPSLFSKAIAIQARTLEIFETMGMISSFLEAGLKSKGVVFHWQENKLQVDLQEADTSFPFILLLAQSETEKILLKYLEQRGTQVEWNTKLVDINGNQVVIEKKGEEKQTRSYQWILGCDGAHSTLRHRLNLIFKGAQFPEHFLIADAAIETPFTQDHLHFFSSKHGFSALLPIGNSGQCRLIFPLEHAFDVKNVDKQQIASLLDQRGMVHPFEIKNVSWISSFQIHRRMTASMRIGNLFLLGDAAHIHSPVGGQGMNTGIQDAYNLCWKLALVIHGVSPEKILDTYEQERHPIAQTVLKGTSLATRFLTFSQKRCPWFFYWGLKHAFSISRLRKKIIGGITELAINYRKSIPLSEDPSWQGPQIGDRAPDCIVSTGHRLFDLLQTSTHLLLLFEKHPEFEKAMHEEYGSLISIHIVASEEAKKKFAAGPHSIYLIRPDGYIGYRAFHFQPEDVFGILLKTFKPYSQRVH